MKIHSKIRKLPVIAFTLFLSVMSQVNAQAQEKTVYAFCYAYSYQTKTLYISNTVNGVENSSTYYNASDDALHNQWRKKLETEDSKMSGYSLLKFGFSADKSKVEEYRTEMISKFTKQEFSIKHVSFAYSKDRR
ncbi:hypothetical protein [Pedobacter chitinilyticus]|uniref:Uncharacterized protein n=1 Tax=Pedobacter chitinilyticus TaxID=2233776 RepID=A0A451GDE6_9SPHI|nr:hypothetical protein [Pedobacter chitinilyticus]RWU10890.1 hypothetical protein DPV69_06045 [Pedobacter chitinilyticus]